MSALYRYSIMFALGLASALFAIYALHAGHISYSYPGDSGKYIRPALGLLQLGKYGALSNNVYYPELERLPLYPLLIYFNYAFFGVHNDVAVVLSQAIMMGSIVVAVGLMTLQIAPRFIWPAAVLTAFCPNLFFRAAVILPDLMFTFFITWGICFLILSFRKRFIVYLILSSIFFGLALMTRPAMLLYPFVTFPFLIYLLKSQKQFTFVKSTLYAILSVVIVIAIITPQLSREKHYAGRYTLTTQNGQHALFWLYPCLETKWGGKRNLNALNNAKQQFLIKSAQLTSIEQTSPAVINNLKKQLAEKLILKIPKLQLIQAVVGSSLKLLFYTSLLGTSEAFHHHVAHVSIHAWEASLESLIGDQWQVLILISQLTLFLLRAFEVIGVIYGLCNSKLRALTLYLFSGTLSFIVISIGVGNPRYRLPIEPEFIIFCIFGMFIAYEQYKKLRAVEPLYTL